MPNKPVENKPILITNKTEERFWNKVLKTENCWIWTGAINPSGYGVIKIDGSNRSSHRVSYVIKHREIPENLFILHKCHNPKCVNPDHLYAGTHLENMKDEVDRQNTRKYKCANPSKYKGVNWSEDRKKWVSYVYINKKIIYIGRHDSEIDAARNHDRISYMRYGQKEVLNFPGEYNLNH